MKPLLPFDLKDTPYTQSFYADSISPKKNGESVELTFKILKVYPGAKYNAASFLSVANKEQM